MRVKLYNLTKKTQASVQAATAGGRSADKMLKRAEGQLNHFIAVVDQAERRNILDSDVGGTLGMLASDAYDQVDLMRASGL